MSIGVGKMQKRQTVLAVCFLLLIMTTAWAAWRLDDAFALPARSSGPLAFFADICQFEGGAGKTATEVFYTVDLSQFNPQSSPDQKLILLIDVVFHSTTGDTIAEAHEKKSIKLSYDKNAGAFSFVDLKKLSLSPGPLVLQLSIRDSVSGLEGVLRKEFEVRDFGKRFSISDLMLSSQLQKAQGKSVFEKGGLIVVPMPSRSFSVADSISQLFVYFEINHLQYASQEPSFYSIQYDVRDSQNRQVFSNTRSSIPKAGANSSRIEKIPVTKVPPGHYRLAMQVTDLATAAVCSAAVDFACLSPHAGEAMVLTMTAEDMQKYFDQIKYLATDQEKDIYWQLSAAGKQNFLLEFWKSKDPTPGTPENEFMKEHFRRIAYCEKKFSGGLNSDMAKIYIKYGSPMEVSREVSTAKINRPVEIWTYALDGRREFVFVDRTGDGRYVMVHSNHPAEYSNPNWMDDYTN